MSDEVYRLTERATTLRLAPVADVYELGVSIGVMSKAYGLPGLRVGWVACRDHCLLDRIAAVRQYLSTSCSTVSEILACIALKCAESITARNRVIASQNLNLLRDFFSRNPAIFDFSPPKAGVVCYPRYMGTDGVDNLARRMAEQAGVLLLPARVFRSELHDLPDGHFRIGFGKLDFRLGLEAFETALR